MSILNNIETSLNGNPIYDMHYEWYEKALYNIKGVTLKRERSGKPYFEINNLKKGVLITNHMFNTHIEGIKYIDLVENKYQTEQANLISYLIAAILPDWLEFRAKPSNYRKTNGSYAVCTLYNYNIDPDIAFRTTEEIDVIPDVKVDLKKLSNSKLFESSKNTSVLMCVKSVNFTMSFDNKFNDEFMTCDKVKYKVKYEYI